MLTYRDSYIGRPEAIESIFYMYRMTGDEQWRDKGWRMFMSWVGPNACFPVRSDLDRCDTVRPTLAWLLSRLSIRCHFNSMTHKNPLFSPKPSKSVLGYLRLHRLAERFVFSITIYFSRNQISYHWMNGYLALKPILFHSRTRPALSVASGKVRRQTKN